MQDMRVLSGCMDGKMRIWNLLTGDCLRLLRGNSRSEPIYHMWPVGDTRLGEKQTSQINIKGSFLSLYANPGAYFSDNKKKGNFHAAQMKFYQATYQRIKKIRCHILKPEKTQIQQVLQIWVHK